jgi:L-threonylcarbamoyladenylate synthase
VSAQNTRILPADAAGLAEAARLILAGEPVAVPTETVYGLAADATSAVAVAKIYAAKGRPSFNPLIVHVPDLAAAERMGDFTAAARAVAERWWPGPVTLVVPLRDDAGLAPAVSAGLATVALRCPAHPAMHALLLATGRPLAAPSANASGTISPTTAAHVLHSLAGRIPLILDGGASERGLESTIVKVEGEELRVLRPGPIALDALLGSRPCKEGGVGGSRERGLDGPDPAPSRIESPGQFASHYAPSKPLRLDAPSAQPDEWLIGFGAVAGDDNLSPSASLDEAAARLFDALHRADASPRPRIAVAPVPDEGLGAAINDRLLRAAAPRSRG